MLVFPIEVHVVGGERNTVIYANAFIWVHMVRSGAMVSCAHTLTRYTWFLYRGRRGVIVSCVHTFIQLHVVDEHGVMFS